MKQSTVCTTELITDVHENGNSKTVQCNTVTMFLHNSSESVTYLKAKA